MGILVRSDCSRESSWAKTGDVHRKASKASGTIIFMAMAIGMKNTFNIPQKKDTVVGILYFNEVFLFIKY
jgi:hypothetical protein